MVIASRLAARNKALLNDLKRDFAVKKATFGTLYVKYRCGTDGEVDRAHSLADLVCVQIKQQLIQTYVRDLPPPEVGCELKASPSPQSPSYPLTNGGLLLPTV
jgi:hypothetical protein